jgi:hypothetical protein
MSTGQRHPWHEDAQGVLGRPRHGKRGRGSQQREYAALHQRLPHEIAA